MTAFKDLLRKYRKRNPRLTQKALGEKVGLPTSYIGGLEIGQRKSPPSYDRLKRLIQVLELNIEEAQEFLKAAETIRRPRKFLQYEAPTEAFLSFPIPSQGESIKEVTFVSVPAGLSSFSRAHLLTNDHLEKEGVGPDSMLICVWPSAREKEQTKISDGCLVLAKLRDKDNVLFVAGRVHGVSETKTSSHIPDYHAKHLEFRCANKSYLKEIPPRDPAPPSKEYDPAFTIKLKPEDQLLGKIVLAMKYLEKSEDPSQ